MQFCSASKEETGVSPDGLNPLSRLQQVVDMCWCSQTEIDKGKVICLMLLKAWERRNSTAWVININSWTLHGERANSSSSTQRMKMQSFMKHFTFMNLSLSLCSQQPVSITSESQSALLTEDVCMYKILKSNLTLVCSGS